MPVSQSEATLRTVCAKAPLLRLVTWFPFQILFSCSMTFKEVELYLFVSHSLHGITQMKVEAAIICAGISRFKTFLTKAENCEDSYLVEKTRTSNSVSWYKLVVFTFFDLDPLSGTASHYAFLVTLGMK